MSRQELLISEVDWWKSQGYSLCQLCKLAGVRLSRLQRLLASEANGRTLDATDEVLLAIRRRRRTEAPAFPTKPVETTTGASR